MKVNRIILFVLVLISFSCKKDSQSNIPYRNVYKELYPNTLDYIPVTGFIYVKDAGYRGLIVYHFSSDEFRIYERCCPYDPEKPNAMVTVNSDKITATDSVCKSSFILLDGSPYGSGPSHYSLLQYHYSYDGDKLIIYN